MAYNIQLVKEKINSILTGINGSNGILKSYGNGIVGVAQGEDVPPIPASKVASGYFPSTRLASADGTDGQILRTDGNGNTYWTDPPTSPGHSDDYNTLTNKPSINSVTLMGNKSLDDLGILGKGSTLSQNVNFYTRQTGDGLIGSRRNALIKKIIGNTVKLNQLVDLTGTQSSGIFTVDSANGKVTATGTPSSTAIFGFTKRVNIVSGHKYLMCGCYQYLSGDVTLGLRDSVMSNTVVVESGNGSIGTANFSDENGIVLIRVSAGIALSHAVFMPMLFDLTAIGIADSITTVDAFKTWLYANLGLTLNQYIAYSQGSLVDFGGEFIGTGKNLFSIGENKTIATRGYVYDYVTLKLDAGSYVLSFDFNGASGSVQAIYTNETETVVSKVITVSNGRNSIATVHPSQSTIFTLYANTSGSFSNWQLEKGSTATTYEPYTANTITLPTLRKAGSVIDELNVDTSGWARSITRRVGTRTYQSGDTDSSTMTTDGVSTTNYALSTQTTETITPIYLGYPCNNNGTESMSSGCAINGQIDYRGNEDAINLVGALTEMQNRIQDLQTAIVALGGTI